jgi:hypothetical protein
LLLMFEALDGGALQLFGLAPMPSGIPAIYSRELG